jgi:hypothetical protein
MHHRQMGNAQLHLSWINNIHKIFEVHLHKNYNEKINKYYHYTISYSTGLEGDASFSKKRFEDSINN